MGKLVLKLPDGRTRDIPLDRERITIGRRATNDVCLPHPGVSGEHAAVVTVLDDSYLEDLNSTNGTLVNGKRITKHFLRDRDAIDIGRQLLVYAAGTDAAKPAPGVARAPARDAVATTKSKRLAPAAAERARPRAESADSPGSAGAAPSPSSRPASRPPEAGPLPAPEPQANAAGGRRVDTAPLVAEPLDVPAAAGPVESNSGYAAFAESPAFEVLEGSGAGRVVPIDRDVFVIGSVGLQVAAATRTADGLRLVHVEGDTPPRINGAALPEEGSLLALGDEIEIAGARLRFRPGH